MIFDRVLIYSALAIATLALVTGVLGLVLLRRQRSDLMSRRRELESIVRKNADRAGLIEKGLAGVTRSVADLELTARNIAEAASGGITRTKRSQAIQLLRSGMPPKPRQATWVYPCVRCA